MEVLFKEYNEIMGRIESSYHEAARKMNLSDSEMNVLYILNDYPEGCNQSMLHKKSGLTKSTLNSALKKMEKNEILCITQGEGRNTWVCATNKGKNLIKNTVWKIIEIENQIYTSWSLKEQELFIQLYREFADKLSIKINELEVDDEHLTDEI